jgi:tetratricopeptide (TPR) repeat protein
MPSSVLVANRDLNVIRTRPGTESLARARASRCAAKSVGIEKDSWGTVGRVANVEDFDEIEFQAARTGNHVRAAVRMSELAQEAEPGLRAEFHLRAGEQWMSADEPQRAADEFSAAIEDGGATFADPRVHLARALLDLGREAEAQTLLAALTADRDAVTPRTCDLLAELFTEEGDLRRALDWATTGVERCIQLGDDAELQLLLRLRYRLRVDLGLPEDDYDHMLDRSHPHG